MFLEPNAPAGGSGKGKDALHGCERQGGEALRGVDGGEGSDALCGVNSAVASASAPHDSYYHTQLNGRQLQNLGAGSEWGLLTALPLSLLDSCCWTLIVNLPQDSTH